MTSPLYVFQDESGNFDFSEKSGATPYYLLGALSTLHLTDLEGAMNGARQRLIERGLILPAHVLHASTDRQVVRNEVFGALVPILPKLRFDLVIVEKAKTYIPLRAPELFYPKMLGYLIDYAVKYQSGTKIIVKSDQLPFSSRSRLVEKAIKQGLAKAAGSRPYELRNASTHGQCHGLAAVDYLTWAVQRKWWRADKRSYNLIEPAIHSEFNIFRNSPRVTEPLLYLPVEGSP